MPVNIMTAIPSKKRASDHKKKRSITINSVLEEKLRDIQSQLINNTKTNWSLSGTINVLILSALLSADKLSKDDFYKIKYFIEDDKITLDNKLIREFVDRIIKN